jgi:hypothetical protein
MTRRRYRQRAATAKLLVAAALGATLLASCEASFGVFRTAELSVAPSASCVRDVIAAIPEIETVDVRTAKEAYGRPTTRFGYHGVAPGAQVHGEIVLQTVDDRVMFSSYAITGVPPPQSYIDATRPIMVRIERNLIETCNMEELRHVEEVCSRANCPPI